MLNGKTEHGQPMDETRGLKIRCGSLSITTQVSPLANEFEVRRVLHKQACLATVNHVYIVHEVMDGY